VTAPGGVRMKLDPDPIRGTVLDGAWWPRSTDAVAELAQLVPALAGLRGNVTHVLLNTGEWDMPHPRRAAEGKSAARLGWYTSQPHGLVTVMTDFGRDRFDLFVVPPDADQASAGKAFTAASDAADGRHAPELLTTIDRTAGSGAAA
jgi:Family of unknown function (DUF5994)